MEIYYSRNDSCAYVVQSDITAIPLTQEDSFSIYVANLKTSEILVINGAGNVIWEFLQTPITQASLIKKISSYFEVNIDTVEEATLQFVKSLIDQGIINKSIR